MNEQEFLKLVFKNSFELIKQAENSIYRIKFKQSVYEFVCTPLYPSVFPTINSHLTPEQLESVYKKAKILMNQPMIYDLVLACVRLGELDLNESLESLVIDYNSDDLPRITAEQFFEWVEKSQQTGDKEEKRTGRLIFEQGNVEE